MICVSNRPSVGEGIITVATTSSLDLSVANIPPTAVLKRWAHDDDMERSASFDIVYKLFLLACIWEDYDRLVVTVAPTFITSLCYT